MQLKVARKEEAGVDRAFITAVPRDNPAWTSMAFIKITRQLGCSSQKVLLSESKYLFAADYRQTWAVGTNR